MIKLHHLNQSRSKRVIWLLEELAVPYEIIPYQRDSQTRFAPKALRDIHPLGKSPVIEDEGMVIAESGAIVEYLIGRYGADTLAPPAGSADHVAYLQWLHFAEGSAALPMLLGYFLHLDGTETRFLHKYAAREQDKILRYMNDVVANQPYLVGNQFTGADIVNAFVLDMTYGRTQLTHYPALKAYWERLMDRPAWKRACELEAQYDSTA